MGIYLNPDNMDFQEALNSKIYVDKSEMIAQVNKIVDTQDRYICYSPSSLWKNNGGEYADGLLQ